jgi:hypothetical protein
MTLVNDTKRRRLNESVIMIPFVNGLRKLPHLIAIEAEMTKPRVLQCIAEMV